MKLTIYITALACFFVGVSTARVPDLTHLADYANALAHAHRDAEAISIYDYIVQQDPTMTGILHNFGFVLARSGCVEKAITVYQHALAIHDEPLTRLNLAIAYLTHGDLQRGFCEYEWRWEAFNEKHDTFPLPRWNGCNLHNKRIYIHAEQGFGDTLQFIRYLFLLKQMGAYVIFNTQAPLKDLLSLCPYIDTVITYDDPLPEFDYYSALLSLPHIFNTKIDTIPVCIPYLYADKRLVDAWHDILSQDKNYKVGICWQGNTKYKSSFAQDIVTAKSCNIEQFRIVASVSGVTLYSLQKIDGTDQIEFLDNNCFVHIFDDSFDTTNGRFMDTAAVIQNLDLVITIDTSIAHLSAALGKETWILLPEPTDWRWMQSRTDTPWYPNVRLFRQKTAGNWSEVMQTVAQDLHHEVHKKSKNRLNASPLAIANAAC